jgi:vitamin B12 transporter
MGDFLRAGLVCLALSAMVARADEPKVLAPVEVPLPEEPPEASAPSDRDLTAAVTVVPARSRQGEVQETSELLREVPGLVVRDTGGLGQAKSLSVRGGGTQGVRVELDGIPLNGEGGIADLSTVPLALVDRLELARGSGARSGSGAMGGVLEIRTRSAQSTPEAAVELSGGSFRTALAQASVTGPLLGGAGLLLVHGERSVGDFEFPFDPLPLVPGNAVETRARVNNDAKVGGALAELRRRVGEWDTEALANLTVLSRGLAGTEGAPTPDARQSLTRWLFGVRAHRDLGQAELFARGYGKLEPSTLTAPFTDPYHQTFGVAGAELLARAYAGAQTLTASLEGGGEWLVANQRDRRGRFSLMAIDDVLFFGRLTLSPSFRYDRVGSANGYSPKLGAALALAGGWSLRANVGEGFRAPSFLELYVRQGTLFPNPTLAPETSRSADLAVSFARGGGSVSLGGFWTDYLHLIRYELYSAFLATPRNVDGARVAGLEAEGRYQARWLTLSASYSLVHSEDMRDDPRYLGNALPYEPEHRLDVRAEAGPDWLRGKAQLDFHSREYTNRAATLAIDPVALVDLGVSARLSHAPELFASLELRNVFDVHTLAFDGYPLPGRAAFLTLSVAVGGAAERS